MEKNGGKIWSTLIKCLLAAMIFTTFLLLASAFVLYRFGLTEKTVSAMIIGIYVSSCFLAGFLAGKVLKNRRFIWGFLEGMAYFVILALVSLFADSQLSGLGTEGLTTWILCAAGGMLGGMLS